MKLTKATSLLAALALTATATTASAVEVVGEFTNVDGAVLVERAGVMLNAQSDSGLLVGDKVIVTDASAASLKLYEGCETSLASATSITVSADGCASIAQVAKLNSEAVASATAYSGPSAAGAALPPIALIAAGLVAVGVIIAVADDDDDPTSP